MRVSTALVSTLNHRRVDVRPCEAKVAIVNLNVKKKTFSLTEIKITTL